MKYLISSRTLTTDFSIHQTDQTCNTYYGGVCLVVIFFISLISSTFISWNFFVRRDIVSPIPVFIQFLF